VQPIILRDDVVELSTPTPDDVPAITDLCQDPAVQEWTTVPSPYTADDATSFVTTFVARGWEDDRDCTWAIRHDGRLVGMIGLSLHPAASAEVGFWLGPASRGRGLLHRSLELVLDHAFADDGLALDRVEWRCRAGNWPSWRAAWRVGFRLEGAVRGGTLQRGRRWDEWIGTLLRGDPREPVAPWPATRGLVPAADAPGEPGHRGPDENATGI
jgi:RimJ/RimL family protein N-acetyltransferase